MKKIMIVDDEMLVRVGIKSLIDWQEYGYVLVAEAFNGVDALAKIEENQPDIILTDIVMDKMDGCQLIAECKERYPNIKFVVLSNYNDYEKVRAAMRLGAVDYIFKLTAKPENILAALKEAEKYSKESVEPLPQENTILLKRNIPVIKEKLMKALMQQNDNIEGFFVQEWQELSLSCDFGKEQVVLHTAIDDYDIGENTSCIPETHLLKYSIVNIAEEVLCNKYTVESFYYKKGDIIFLLHTDQAEEYAVMKKQICSKSKTIRAYVQRYLGIEISCALSQPFCGFENFKEAVLQAECALQERFWNDKELYFLQEDIKEEKDFFLPALLSSPQIEEVLDRGAFVEIQADFKSFAISLKHSRSVTSEELRAVLSGLYYQIFRAATKKGILLDNFIDCNGVSMQRAINEYESVDKIFEAFDKLISFCHTSVEQNDSVKQREEISFVRKAIWGNLGQEWAVKDAASLANMSESHFSHLFKKICGTSFIQYVNTIRIKKAKELLIDTNMTLPRWQ